VLSLSSAFSLALVVPLSAAHVGGPAPEPDEERSEEAEEDADAEAQMSPAEQKASRQVVGGAVAGSFGFSLALVAFGLLGARATCELEGNPDCARNMGIAALTTGIPGLALMATGGALLGLGIKRRRALSLGSSTARVTPWFDRQRAGAAFTLRF
jgi:hypothetical protein